MLLLLRDTQDRWQCVVRPTMLVSAIKDWEIDVDLSVNLDEPVLHQLKVGPYPHSERYKTWDRYPHSSSCAVP